MATPRSRPQTVAFVPSGAEQSVSSRTLPLGRLVEVTNARQVKKGEWRKRLGFGRTVPAVDSSGYGNASAGDSVYAGALVERDLAGQFWALGGDGNRKYRGAFGSGAGERPFPSYQSAGITQSTTNVTDGPRRSQVALGASSDEWVFSVGQDQFQWVVYGADGATKRATQIMSSTAVQQVAAVYDPLNSIMWALALNATGTTVTSYKFDSTGAFVSSFTYHAGLVGGSTIDAKWLSSPGEMAVVVAQYDSATPRCRVTQSYLNPATGIPRAAPAAVNHDITPNVNRPNTCGGVRILISSGLTTWYYAFWRASANANTLDLVLNSVTTATLANAGAAVLTSQATGATESWRGVTSGYVDTSNGNRVVFAQNLPPSTLNTRTYDIGLIKYTWNGASTTTASAGRGAWLASDPVLVGSRWYYATGRDTGYNTVPAAYGEFYRTGDLYLREASTGRIVSVALQSAGPCFWHRPISLYNDTAGVQANAYDQSVTTLVLPSANKIAMACGRTGELLQTPEQVIVSWDFAAIYGPPVALGTRDTAVFPGPIPMAVGPRQTAREVFPLHAPPVPRVTLGTTGATGVASVCLTYRFLDADGVAYESSPSPAYTGTFFFNDNVVTAAMLKHVVGGVNAQICMWSTGAGGSIFTLQAVAENDPTVNSATFKIWPVASDFPQFVALHTNGGGLSHAQAPPCRSVAFWRDRLFLAGTPTEGEVWSSQEVTEGAAPDLSEILRSFWNDASGPILGLRPIDWNYLAGFKRNGVGVIGGPGPDGRGQGGYAWQTLTTEKGLSDTALASPVSTPFGCEFQNDADGRWCLVGTDLQVRDIMQGADSHASKTVVCALLNEAEREVWAFCTDGTILARGYAFPDQSSPYGDWRRWTSANLLRAYGAVMTPTGPVYIEQGGVLRAPAAATWTDAGSGGNANVHMALETGRMAPFGLLQEGAVVGTHILGQYVSSEFLRVTVTPDDGSGSIHTIPTGSVIDFSMKPTGCFRCKEARVRVEETDSLGGEGLIFEGIGLDVIPFGRARILPVSQRIA